MNKSAIIERLLRAGGKTARQIAAAAGCSVAQVYRVADKIHVLPVGRMRARTEAEIRADLASQLEGICSRFHALVTAARRQEFGL